MKLILAFIFASCLGASAQLTNILAVLQSVPKNKQACMPTYFYVGQGAYKPSAVQASNTWYYPDGTNVLTVTCTNSDAMINITTSFGNNKCAKGTLIYTNSFYPQDTFRFTLFWSNNIVPPTNQIVTLAVTGLRTNSP